MILHWNKWAPLNTTVTAHLVFKTCVSVLTEYPKCCGVTDVPHDVRVKKLPCTELPNNGCNCAPLLQDMGSL